MDLGIKRKVALVLGGSQGLELSAAAPMSEVAATMVLNGNIADNGSANVFFMPRNINFVRGNAYLPIFKVSIIDLKRFLAGQLNSSWTISLKRRTAGSKTKYSKTPTGRRRRRKYDRPLSRL